MQRYYDAVAAELKNRQINEGLWARALAESGADDSRARARYIKLRVDFLREKEQERIQGEEERVETERDGMQTEAEGSRGPSFARVLLYLVGSFLICAVVYLIAR